MPHLHVVGGLQMRLHLAAPDVDGERGRNPVSIAEICDRRGFADQAYFSRIFKQQFGASPRDYRHRHLQY
jgi:AraC-like DNA-binding protein